MRKKFTEFSHLNDDIDFENKPIERMCYTNLQNPISRGNYGKIFDLNKNYVVKVCECDNIFSVIPEINILSSFSHKSVLKAHYIFKKNNEMMFVVPKYDCTLRDISTECQAIKNSVTIQLCESLNYIHSKFYIHLDLTLKNILVKIRKDYLHICICDFSLSRYIPSGKLITKIPKITANYKPYENLLGSQEYSFKSDCWSLGVCLYEFYENKELINFSYISEKANTIRAHETCCLFEIQKIECEGNWPPTQNILLRGLLDLNIETRIDTYELASLLNCKTYKRNRLKTKEIVDKLFSTSRIDRKKCYRVLNSLSKDFEGNDDHIFDIISRNKGFLTF